MSCGTEIEIKAHVADLEMLWKKLDQSAKFLHEYDKRDSYFYVPLESGKKAVRLRQDSSRWFLTAKDKTVRQAVEVNQEAEFEIQDQAAVLDFLAILGAQHYYSKQKTGRAYEYKGYLIETGTVSRLGGFMEVEFVGNGSLNVEEIITGIKQVFFDFGIPEENFEEKSYSRMIKELG